MTLKATASPLLQMSVFAPKNWTGAADSQIQITGYLPEGQQVQIGSSLSVLIPAEFQIPDLERSSS